MNDVFFTILPPNGPTCTSEGTGETISGRLTTASSFHNAGVNAVFADASVRFISETIDAGDPNVTPNVSNTGLSQWGVWGALGTKSGGEMPAGDSY